MTHITPASNSTAGLQPVDADPAPEAGATQADPGATHAEGAEHPLARFALGDLHRAVQRFAHDAGLPNTPVFPHGNGGQPVPLYGGKQPQAAPVQQTPAPPAIPGVPIDVARMEALNNQVQKFRVADSPLETGRLRYTQRVFQAATDALKAHDYPKAQQELAKLGLPLPPMHDKPSLTDQQLATAHLLGVPATGTSQSWQLGEVKWGKGGNQGLNDLNGFAANAIMVNRMAAAPGGVDNPPTEAQATKYMREFAQPANGTKPNAEQVMRAASEITGGMVMHYSSAGRSVADPVYDANPNPRAFYKDGNGKVHEFDSAANAQKAADAKNPPKGAREQITIIASRSPDRWSDVTSQGTRAGRYIGDCESKVYLQTRLLTEAGFTSLGSVDVHPKGGGTGHMLGVFKAPDGSVWVTSNEEFRRVRPADAAKGVTQADLEVTIKEMTAATYGIEPNYKGELDLSDFTFSAAATAKLSGPTAAVDSIRRCTELLVLGRSDTLIPLPIKP